MKPRVSEQRRAALLESVLNGMELGSLSAEEEALVVEYQAMLAGLTTAAHSAPRALIEAAEALMPPRVAQRRPARLLSTTLLASAARLAPGSTVQSLFELDGGSVRVMYLSDGSGCDVLGRVTGLEIWTVQCGGVTVDCPDGQFRFKVSHAGETGLVLNGPAGEFALPAVTDQSNGTP